MTSRGWLAAVAVALCMAFHGRPVSAQIVDLTKLSLKDLLNIEVTSVSRKEQTLSRTAAAVYIITDEDIRRSGAKTVPDLLRMVPGFAVAQIDATTWAVTARGFNGLYANKLLVLVDGRSVYSPLFGGVVWEVEHLPLYDIERIEVVRGPGGSLWGTNAVNGVINIITKPAAETQGTLANVTFGGVQRTAAGVRYGGRIGVGVDYRVYGNHSIRGTRVPVQTFLDPDDADVSRGGFRVDWRGAVDRVSIQGSIQTGESGHVRTHTVLSAPWTTMVGQRRDFTDGTVLASWTRSASSRVETSVQASHQEYVRHQAQVGYVFGERSHIAELEVRQRRALGRRHELVGGVGYRFWATTLENVSSLSFLPGNDRSHLVTAFIQDEIEIADRLHVTPGSKFEHNEYTGLEVQPSLKVTWAPTATNAFWAAVSRSVRTPSKADRGLRVPAGASPGFGGMPLLIMIEGNAAIDSERVTAFEAGYRTQAGRVSVDVTAFRNAYQDLITVGAVAPRLGTFEDRPVTLLPLRFDNLLTEETRGVEATVAWRPAVWWRTSLSSALLQFKAHAQERNIASGAATPEWQHSFRSYLDLPGNLEASGFVYRVGAIQSLMPAYTGVNARVAWRVRPAVEFAVGVENLFHDNTLEFVEMTGLQSSPTRTAAFGEISWRF